MGGAIIFAKNPPWPVFSEHGQSFKLVVRDGGTYFLNELIQNYIGKYQEHHKCTQEKK